MPKCDPDTDDPLWLLIKPPPNETPEQAAIRMKREAEAKIISDKIDEAIRAERESLKKKKTVRLLLLGQSESGKSTIIKQFQLLHSPNAFQNGRMSWRLVIQLNLVKSIRRILETVINASQNIDSQANPNPFIVSDDRWDTSSSDVVHPRVESSASSMISVDTAGSNDFSGYETRLMPLLRAEQILSDTLRSPDTLAFRGDALGGREGYNHLSWPTDESPQELFVRPGDLWNLKSDESNGGTMGLPEEPAKILYGAREDMMMLWANPTVQDILRQKKVNLSESSGFFLNDMERITARDYVPTDKDILHARLKTVGVVEHIFELRETGEKAVDWRIYDVGGSKSQRATWAPFFDSVQAIIFLSPVSVFDEVLAEDPSVNRLEDSFILWRELCKNVILTKVPLVLFLNKCDLLRRKLSAGVLLSRFVISYGDRPNDYETVLKYFKAKFDGIRKQYSKNPERPCYVYTTSAGDPHQAVTIISSVRDTILKDSLRSTRLI